VGECHDGAGAVDHPSLETGSTLKSGALHYTQVEPFAEWRYSFEGRADYTRQEDTLKLGGGAREPGPLCCEIDIRCATSATAKLCTNARSRASRPGTG